MPAPVDIKQVRVRCPVCYHPEPLLATACMTCGELLDPRRSWETYEANTTHTH